MAQFSKPSINLSLTFYKLTGLLTPLMLDKIVAHLDACIDIFDGCWIKSFVTKIG